MGATEIFCSFLALTALVICWLLWEIHQKLHRILELNWQSSLAIEKRLETIEKQIKS